MTTNTLPIATHANINFVTPSLAIGGDLSQDLELCAHQVLELEELGFTHVIDCRLEWNDEELFAEHLPQIAYLHHGIDDAGQLVPAEWFDAAMEWLADDAVVLTHCHMGINRGPSLGFAVLLHQGWDPVDAMAAIRAARPIAHVWYAADALLWQHGRNGSDPTDDLRRLKQWHEENPLDVVRIIRQQRRAGF